MAGSDFDRRRDMERPRRCAVQIGEIEDYMEAAFDRHS